MTIAEFNNNIEYADKCLSELKSVQPNLSDVIQLLNEAINKKQEIPMNQIREHINQAIIATNKAHSHVSDYRSLLDEIARKTDIDWPPICRMKK